MSAVTAITAQSTVGVTSVEFVSPDAIVAQVNAVAGDIGVDAVKIGMLGTPDAVEAVGRALDLVADAPVVLDPVMVAESGAPLSDDATRAAFVDRLLRRATVVTPNVAEARILASGCGGPAARPDRLGAAFDELAALAEAIHALGPDAAVVTAGHAAEPVDAFCDGERLERIDGSRQESGAAHGSGCTHSSALAASLALGTSTLDAARFAKAVAEEAVAHGLRGVGAGAGPVNALGGLVPPRAPSARLDGRGALA